MVVAFLDPYLSFVGPCFEYDTSIINELKKRQVSSLLFCADFADEQTIKKANAIPEFHYLAKLITSVMPPKIFYTISEYKKIFKQIPQGAVLFIPNIFSGKELFTLSLSLLFTPTKKFKKIIFLYRLIPDKANQLLFYKLSNSILKSKIKKKLVIPVADSEIVAEICNKLVSQEVHVLPIPHVIGVEHFKTDETFKNKLIKIYLPGEARIDKGIQTVLAAVAQLVAKNEFNNFELTIQFNPLKLDATYLAIKEKIEELKIKANIRMLSRLNSEQYYNELMNADIVLTPYMAKTVNNIEGYHSRTSGIFSEAIAAAKPVITTKDTWMSYQLEKFGSGICITEYAFDELAKALIDMAASLDHYKQKAKETAGVWASIHNAQSFCDRFLALCNN